MAQKLHDTYGFSYDKLQVLLGGWNTWNEKHGSDPNGYPIDSDPSAVATTQAAQTDVQGTPISLTNSSPVVINPQPPVATPPGGVIDATVTPAK